MVDSGRGKCTWPFDDPSLRAAIFGSLLRLLLEMPRLTLIQAICFSHEYRHDMSLVYVSQTCRNIVESLLVGVRDGLSTASKRLCPDKRSY